MLKAGTLVLIISPGYAAGLQGYIQAQEPSGRWIVKLEENPFDHSDEPFLLSLEESEFEVIES